MLGLGLSTSRAHPLFTFARLLYYLFEQSPALRRDTARRMRLRKVKRAHGWGCYAGSVHDLYAMLRTALQAKHTQPLFCFAVKCEHCSVPKMESTLQPLCPSHSKLAGWWAWPQEGLPVATRPCVWRAPRGVSMVTLLWGPLGGTFHLGGNLTAGPGRRKCLPQMWRERTEAASLGLQPEPPTPVKPQSLGTRRDLGPGCLGPTPQRRHSPGGVAASRSAVWGLTALCPCSSGASSVCASVPSLPGEIQ